ncbi:MULTISPECIES: hypothetical protein [Sphingobacterium]|uniref:Lasso RiPP family leader peptide-containing protein n=1 Tax=Sphingobacterium ginsenosidimutans TaxID=687845 RepID=A0ABP7ZYT9_9SPHI|nr:hypothetical protein [Sphingobacterium sp. E70]ULT27224.1 hypothetical protein KUH03_10980 [Sphingobacterium sp. E70]
MNEKKQYVTPSINAMEIELENGIAAGSEGSGSNGGGGGGWEMDKIGCAEAQPIKLSLF